MFRNATLTTGVLEQNLTLDQFPSPQELWARYCKWKGWSAEVQNVAAFNYALATTAKTPRYYQLNAINRTVEAIATGKNRVLLVMATGTDKTYTAFQIIHRLWKSPWHADKPSSQKRNRTNSYDLVGKTGLFEGFHREVTFASYLIRVKLMEGLVSPQYVDMYMNTRDCRVNEIEPDLTQQTGQANYNGTKLKSIRIPLPPLAEQSRIVTRVAQLRRLCAALRQRLSASQSTQVHLAKALVENGV